MSMFKPSEIFQFAIRIEENGEKFYRTMAEKINQPEAKTLFGALADEEVKHKKTYEGMVKGLENYEPPENYPGEYFEYLKAYANNHIFTEDQLLSKIADIKDAESALTFAMARELDSILYYQEIKKMVPKNDQDKIDGIIDEERKHYVKLSGCKDAVCVTK